MSARTAAATITVFISVAIQGLKAYGDARRHHQHDAPHSQRCECFSMCLPCMISAAREGGRAAE